MLSKNKILRDFWETQSLKNGLNRRFWKKIVRLWLRHLRFESLYLCQRGTRYSSEYLVFLLQKEIKDSKNRYYEQSRVTRLSGPIQNLWFCKWAMFLLRVYNAIKPITSFCQVFKVEICEANTTVTWQVDIICHKAGSFTLSLFLCPNTAFYGGIRVLFLCLKILWESLRDSKRRQISKFQSHFSAI